MDKNDVIMTAWLFESICKSSEGLIYRKGAEDDTKGGAAVACGGCGVKYGEAVARGGCGDERGAAVA